MTIVPSKTVAVKIASALIHAEEFMSTNGHPNDKDAFDSLMADAEVKKWLHYLSDLALLPVKRGEVSGER